MTPNEYAMCSLVCASTWGDNVIIDKNVQYDKILLSAKEQAILILSNSLLSELPLSDKDCIRIDEERVYQIAQFIKYLKAQKELTRILESEGIRPVILKGIASAYYYENPIIRVLGDIDFIVPKGDFNKAKEILLSAGYKPGWGETDDKRHLDFNKEGIPFEMHRCFLEEEPPANGDGFDAQLFSSLSNAPLRQIYGFSFYMLPDIEHGISVLQHIRHHLSGGIGLRQIMDWLNFVNKKLDDELWNDSFRKRAEELGLGKLAIILTHMGEMYLGLKRNGRTWYMDADETICEELMEHILLNGNFGRKRDHSRNKTVAVLTDMRQGFFLRLKRAGEINDAYDGKNGVFRYTRQLIRYVKQGMKAGQSLQTFCTDLIASRKQSILFKKLGINRH